MEIPKVCVVCDEKLRHVYKKERQDTAVFFPSNPVGFWKVSTQKICPNKKSRLDDHSAVVVSEWMKEPDVLTVAVRLPARDG